MMTKSNPNPMVAIIKFKSRAVVILASNACVLFDYHHSRSYKKIFTWHCVATKDNICFFEIWFHVSFTLLKIIIFLSWKSLYCFLLFDFCNQFNGEQAYENTRNPETSTGYIYLKNNSGRLRYSGCTLKYGVFKNSFFFLVNCTVLLSKCLINTEMCKKYRSLHIFTIYFHIKPHFFIAFFFDFDEIFTNKRENVCRFL